MKWDKTVKMLNIKDNGIKLKRRILLTSPSQKSIPTQKTLKKCHDLIEKFKLCHQTQADKNIRSNKNISRKLLECKQTPSTDKLRKIGRTHNNLISFRIWNLKTGSVFKKHYSLTKDLFCWAPFPKCPWR